MSAVADTRVHPLDSEARELRRSEIRHAAKALYLDPQWIGAITVLDWLRRIHYTRDEVILGWINAAKVSPLRPVNDLRVDQRGRLIRQMLDYAKAQS